MDGNFLQIKGNWLSGAIRPGLIEARFPPRSRCRHVSGYPGQFAPASLKHGLERAQTRFHTGLSGAIRPGLIEALSADFRILLNHLVIRGNSPRPH